jgi:hypothetical protein
MRRRIQLKDFIKSFVITVIILIVIITPLIALRVSHDHSYNNAKKLAEEIKNNPSVLDVKIFSLEERAFFSFHHIYAFEIFFNTGGNIIVYGVNQWGKSWKETPMKFNVIDDYWTCFYDKNGNKYYSYFEIWSEILGVQLEDNIMDVIKNYDAISKRMGNFTDMADHRKNEDESFRKVLNRIINEKLYSESIMYKGQEVFLLKDHNSTKWGWDD